MTNLQPAIWKNKSLIFKIILGILFAESLWAQSLKDTLGLTGSVRAGLWEKDKSYSNKKNYGVGSLWINLKPEEINGYKISVEGFVQNQNFTRKNYSEGDVKEAYVEKTAGDFDFKFGRFITVWGRADKFNPTDNLTAKNLKLLMTDDEDQRMGLFSFQTAYNIENTRWIAIWIPEWRTPVLPIEERAGISFKTNRPENSQNQYGLKLDQSGGVVDWSVSYFDGFNKTPDIEIVSASMTGIQLGLNYNKIKVYGADFATTLGSIGIRGEAAYVETGKDAKENPLEQNSFTTVVLGADQTMFENFNLNAQFIYKKINNYEDPNKITNPNTKTLAQNASLNSHQEEKEIHGISLRPSYKMYNETLELEVAIVAWLNRGDHLIRPKITYAINDTTKLYVGGEYYNGKDDTYFGRLKEISSAFAEVRYLF